MLKTIELTGNLSDYKIVNLILQLKDIKQIHKIGSTHVAINGTSIDARLIYKALDDLEKIAKKSNLVVKSINADSSLDELLGNTKLQNIKVVTSLDVWALLQQLDKTND